ncbi:MAG: hypothetical protein K8W52_11350 [Deltaproteobacteria bacterium]|nr:hypothetical protein [Deltaproteobacteria bacterium]
MNRPRRFHLALRATAALLLIATTARETLPQPARRRPATQADIARLEQKLADQQRLLDNLVKLQQQYLQAMAGLMPTPTDVPPSPPAVPEPAAPEAPEPPVIKQTVAAAPPRVRKPTPRRKGVGTVVGKVKGGGGDAFVYIEDVVATAHGAASMKQQGKQFVPQVLVVQKGTRVEFPNLDAVFHNVFSVTPDSSFDLGSYRQGESKSVTMTKPGVVNVYCNMHSQMQGYILVVPGSLYTHVGQDGFYRLANVPAGKHRLVTWAPNAKPVTVDIEVADNAVVTAEVDIKRGRASAHPDKDGLPYGSYKD